MTIKLVDLLIETIFEDTNRHPVYDEYLTNPQTGKNIKVKSALSDTQHPMYQMALAYIKDKTGSEELPTGQQPAAVDPEASGEETGQAEETSKAFDHFTNEEAREIANDAAESITASNDKLEKHKVLSEDPEKWESLSDEFKAAAIVGYRESEREKFTAIQSVVDAYALEGAPVPPEIQADFDASTANVEDIDKQEAAEAEESEDGKSWTESFKETFLDDETLTAFDSLLDDPEAEQQGI